MTNKLSTKLTDLEEDKVNIKRCSTEFSLKDANLAKGEVCYAVDTKRCLIWDGSSLIPLGTINEDGNQTSHPTNCINCGAVLHSCRCEYCGTEYFGLRRTNHV